MHRRIVLLGTALTLSFLAAALVVPVVDAQGLQPSEYGAVALIYNSELSALGKRALFPICIEMPSGTPTKPLLEYLRKGGFENSDESVCEPAMAPGGQHHPKDYPHGLRIFIDKVQRDPAGVISMHVQTDDLTLRPGEHLAQTLRRGTYLLKRNEAGEWQIADYKKEYDSAEEKGQDKWRVAHSLQLNFRTAGGPAFEFSGGAGGPGCGLFLS